MTERGVGKANAGGVTDQELCRRVSERDRAAFGVLYDRYVDAVRALVLARGGLPDLTWDLVQETFTHALAALDAGQIPDRFDLWIRRIALNVVRDHCRRAYRKHERTTEPSAVPDTADSEPDADLAIVVRGLLASLGPDLRDVVTLHFYQGLGVDDVARVLEIPAGTVKSRLSRAYRKLGDGLAGRPRPSPSPSPDDQRGRGARLARLPYLTGPRPGEGGSKA